MDITMKTEKGRFNFRVCAVMLSEGRILAMKDERSPYYYLPGGRVQLHETMENAVVREVQEELGINVRIDRPLWLNQGFFTEDVSGERYHEICMYYLIDFVGSSLLSRGQRFIQKEGKRVHVFEWLPMEELESKYFYPEFIKRKGLEIPEKLVIQAEYE